MTLTPVGPTLKVKVESTNNGVKLQYGMLDGTCTYIAPLNPRFNGNFVATVCESSPRLDFTITNMLDGTPADEYLKYDCDHILINVAASTDPATRKTTFNYSGAILGLSSDGIIIKKLLTHEECIAQKIERIGYVTKVTRYADYANDSRAEEERLARTVWISENQIYL